MSDQNERRSDDPETGRDGSHGKPSNSASGQGGNSSKKGQAKDLNSPTDTDIDFILDIPLEITVELGRTKMLINDLLKLGQGAVIELTKSAGDTLEILANNRLIAKGDVVVVNDKYGIRLTEVITPVERVEKLG